MRNSTPALACVSVLGIFSYYYRLLSLLLALRPRSAPSIAFHHYQHQVYYFPYSYPVSYRQHHTSSLSFLRIEPKHILCRYKRIAADNCTLSSRPCLSSSSSSSTYLNNSSGSNRSASSSCINTGKGDGADGLPGIRYHHHNGYDDTATRHLYRNNSANNVCQVDSREMFPLSVFSDVSKIFPRLDKSGNFYTLCVQEAVHNADTLRHKKDNFTNSSPSCRSATKTANTSNVNSCSNTGSILTEVSGSSSSLNSQLLLDNNGLGRFVGVKDNISFKGYPLTLGCDVLNGYTCTYTSNVLRNVQKHGGIVIGKTTMDAFAMGSGLSFVSRASTTSNQYTVNAIDSNYTPGGSSAGSSSAVSNESLGIRYGVGSDTGGSVRLPAAFNAVVGLKPTQYLVSRHGLTAYASSTDCIGTITRNVMDAARILQVIAGYDPKDTMTVDYPVPNYIDALRAFKATSAQNLGANMSEVALSFDERNSSNKVYYGRSCATGTCAYNLDIFTSAYYALAFGEAVSNLARFDGLRYGNHAGNNYTASGNRAALFPNEAKIVVQKLKQHLNRLFSKLDVIISPTSPFLPPRLGFRSDGPDKDTNSTLFLYDEHKANIFLIPASLVGLPALSVPMGAFHKLPMGLQLMSKQWDEITLFKTRSGAGMELNDASDFTAKVTSSTGLCCVLFYAKWHPAALHMATKVLHAVSDEFPSVRFFIVDMELFDNIEIFQSLRPIEKERVPVGCFFRDGRPIMQLGGLDPPRLCQALQKFCQPVNSAANVSNGNTGKSSKRQDESIDLTQLVRSFPVLLFMKGDRQHPFCKFSRAAIGIMDEIGVNYETFNILENDSIRQHLKEFSNWPTYPQLYVEGEFIGGIDIMKEMHGNGSLITSLPKTSFSKEMNIDDKLKELTTKASVMLFIKGSPSMPQCGFTKQLIEIIDSLGIDYEHFDILSDNKVREEMKRYSEWPTYPQVYVQGSFVGGLDVIKEVLESGGKDALMRELGQ